MDRLKNLILTNWQKEDIMDLLDEYPNFFEKNISELQNMKKGFYLEANFLIDEANRLETKANAIKSYLEAIGEE